MRVIHFILRRLLFRRRESTSTILPEKATKNVKSVKHRSWLVIQLLSIFQFCFKTQIPQDPSCENDLISRNAIDGKSETKINGSGTGGGDTSIKKSNVNKLAELLTDNTLERIPSHIRMKIWNLVNPSDLLGIRATCKKFQKDIDQAIGLNMTINSSNHDLRVIRQMNHPHGIKVNVLIIDDMYNRTISNHFLTQLRHVGILGIGPKPISILNIRLLLDAYPSIATLLFDLDLQEYGDHLSTDYLHQTLDVLFQHPGVQDLKYRITNRQNILKRENKLPPDGWEYGRNGKLNFDYKIRLKALNICYPEITLHELLKWKICLISQSGLKQLICNFDSICWIYFQSVLKNCASALVHLELYNLTNHNGDINDTVGFNWSLISGMVNLKILKLHGDSRYYGLRTVNLGSWEMSQLEELELKYVDLKLDEICHIFDAPWLKVLKCEYFSPIPNPISFLESNSIGSPFYTNFATKAITETNEFIFRLSDTLAWRTMKKISFTDYRLPGNSSSFRRRELINAAQVNGYKCTWSDPSDQTRESVDFEVIE